MHRPLPPHPLRRSSRAVALAVMIAGVGVVAACSGNPAETSSESSGSADSDMVATPSPEVAPDSGADKSLTAEPAVPAPGAPDGVATRESDSASGAGAAPADGSNTAGSDVTVRRGDRKIVYTGSITVEVDSTQSATAKAKALVEAAGGYLSAEESSFGDESESVLTFKVPPEKFDSVMDQIAKLGEAIDRRASTQDVTGAVTDLTGRTATLKKSILRLQGFLDKTTDPNQIAFLEQELLQREQELESIQGQLSVLDSQVQDATIVATLRLPDATDKPADDDSPGFMDGLRTGWEAFINAVNAVVVVLATLLPFLVLAAAIWLIGRLIWKRRAGGVSSSSDTPPSATPPAGGPPAGGPPAGDPTPAG